MHLLSGIKSLIGGSGRFNPRPAANRIPATRIRPITAKDHASCRQIYKANEETTVPDGFIQDFEQDLASDRFLWLGIEEDNELIAIGAIRLNSDDLSAAALSFGMVRPDKQKMGYGSALLTARLASLPRPDPVTRVVMSSLEPSAGFYRRFGFALIHRKAMDNGVELNFYCAELTRHAWETARALLASGQVRFDPDAVSVPNSPFRD
ncbi:MAG: GNAT family N-acetyltransferase [Pseudomonadota bacterium]